MTQKTIARLAIVALGLATVANLAAEDLAPLPLKLPKSAFTGTPPNMQIDSHVEEPTDTPRPAFMAPKGCVNLAAGKKVTSSDKNPFTGTLEMVTDGDKAGSEDSILELHRGSQWVQIDLEQDAKISAIVFWLAHDSAKVFHDLVVQVADDADFTKNVQTLFNNDYDNSSGMGVGKDKEYFENYQGRLVDAKGAKARYVRIYSNGSTSSSRNAFTEVEVWGLPAK